MQITTPDREAITDVLHLYFWLVDHDRADETVPLFTSTATFTFGPGTPKPGTITDVPTFLAGRKSQTHVTSRHVISNMRFTTLDAATVQVDAILTLYRSDSSMRDSYPVFVADISDVLKRIEGQWRIHGHAITPIFNRS